MLQYALLHLFGYNITLDDLKAFRTVDSITPGHPEAQGKHVDSTTGIRFANGPLRY